MELVSGYLAGLAKERGFRQETQYSYYKNELTSITPPYEFPKDELKYLGNSRVFVPTQDQLNRWFREEHNLNIGIMPINFPEENRVVYSWYVLDFQEDEEDDDVVFYESWEDALEMALTFALKLIQD